MNRPRFSVALLICSLVLGAGLFGLFHPLDNVLRDLRLEGEARAPSGTLVFVDIDSRSLEAVGVWPWPRSVHGRLVDMLMDAGVGDVAFDVDFSTASTEPEDAALEAALERAGGYVQLAALRQLADAGGEERFNLPLARFRQYADPVTVNVAVDGSGIVRSYPFGMLLGGDAYPSLASALSGVNGPVDGGFIIDYGIDPAAVDRISVADLLDGSVDPARLAEKSVIIGASALELRDTFVVPRHGVLPGSLVQIIAAETLKQGRALQPLGWLIPGLVIAFMGLVAIFFRERIALPLVIGGGLLLIALVESFALLLQVRSGMLLDTAAIDVAQAAFLLHALFVEVKVRREAQVEASRQRDATQGILDRVIQDNFDGVVVVAGDGKIVAASRLAEEILGAGLVGRQAGDMLPTQINSGLLATLGGTTAASSGEPAELSLPGVADEPRIIEYAITRSEIGGAGVRPAAQRIACLTFRDISERRRSEERLKFLASHDPLTGALSRLEIVEVTHARLASERGRAAGVTMIIIDLSRFKTVNETLGHGYGDMVLKQVSGRLHACSADAIARLGGDSFAMMLHRAMPADELTRYCTEVLSRIVAPYALSGGHQALIAASAGATTSVLSGYDPDVILSHADMALSAAKALPGGGVAMFAQEMDERLQERQDMDVALRQAVEKQQLYVTFQVQVSLADDRTVGVEALVRWQHPELGAVSPARFIPAAEETGQIIEIGRWILNEACHEVASWPEELKLAVNVSPIQFELSDVVGDVKAALAKSGLPAHRLEVEITEGIFVDKSQAIINALEELRALGVGVALDDFGTGYSSLSYLGRLPLDKIKIDQSFVKRLPADPEAGAIIRAVMTLSETLDKIVIAEGIENADQAWMLRMMGCKLGQGYFFGRPRTGAEMLTWFAERADGVAKASQATLFSPQ